MAQEESEIDNQDEESQLNESSVTSQEMRQIADG